MAQWRMGRKNTERRSSSRGVIPHERFQRLGAEVKIRGMDTKLPSVAGRTFLHDLSPKGIGLFVEQRFQRGALVEIVIEGVRPLYLKGRVAWCGESQITGKVLRKVSFAYRIGVELHFDDSEDERLLRSFCDEIKVRSPERQMHGQRSYERRLSLRRALIALCEATSETPMNELESLASLRPTSDELGVAVTEVRALDPGSKWNQRVNHVERLVRVRLGY